MNATNQCSSKEIVGLPLAVSLQHFPKDKFPNVPLRFLMKMSFILSHFPEIRRKSLLGIGEVCHRSPWRFWPSSFFTSLLPFQLGLVMCLRGSRDPTLAVATLTYRPLRDGGQNLNPRPPPVFLRLMTRRVTQMIQKQRTRNMLFRNTWVLTMIWTMMTWLISDVRHLPISCYRHLQAKCCITVPSSGFWFTINTIAILEEVQSFMAKKRPIQGGTPWWFCDSTWLEPKSRTGEWTQLIISVSRRGIF